MTTTRISALRTVAFMLVCVPIALFGCVRHRVPAAAPSTPAPFAMAPSPVSSPSNVQPTTRIYVYSPLMPYRYDPRIPPASTSMTYEGRAPDTDEELRQAIADNPDSRMAKAQELYVREDGQRMWRYTETIPLEQKIELQSFEFKQQSGGGHFDGSILLRNMTEFPIMDLSVTLMTQRRPIVLVPPNHPDGILVNAGEGKSYTFSGDTNGPSNLASARLRVEAQIEGPPGLVVAEANFPDAVAGRR